MNQNDILKRHQNDINDKALKNLEILGLFSQTFEKSFMSYTYKIGKIVSAIYLVTDVMDPDLPLTGSLRNQSLDLLNQCYQTMTSKRFASDELARVVVRIEQVITLVEIGSIAHHVSPMNADIIVMELGKIKELLFVDITAMRAGEKSFVIHKPGMTSPIIPESMLTDRAFDQLIQRYESKRHQNDIKTTLASDSVQNDIINDNYEIKTTKQNDIDRKQELLSFIKSRHSSNMLDIKGVMTEWSDKTIQRELATLIDMGLVRREGNKRWAVYRAVG